jgi:hypothetical protein
MSDSGKANDLLGQLPAGRGPAPVHLWNPPFCGDIDMRIARDGTWYYQGTPINRPAMVKLFSNVLLREGDDYFLVTPVEKVGIRVDVAPFVVVAMAVEGQGESQVLRMTTLTGEVFEIGAQHPLRVEIDPLTQEPAPYVSVRGNLEALVHRNVFYQLVNLADTYDLDGQQWLGVWAAGERFTLGPLPS